MFLSLFFWLLDTESPVTIFIFLLDADCSSALAFSTALYWIFWKDVAGRHAWFLAFTMLVSLNSPSDLNDLIILNKDSSQSKSALIRVLLWIKNRSGELQYLVFHKQSSPRGYVFSLFGCISLLLSACWFQAQCAGLTTASSGFIISLLLFEGPWSQLAQDKTRVYLSACSLPAC